MFQLLSGPFVHSGEIHGLIFDGLTHCEYVQHCAGLRGCRAVLQKMRDGS